jgi:hypothetical protein
VNKGWTVIKLYSFEVTWSIFSISKNIIASFERILSFETSKFSGLGLTQIKFYYGDSQTENKLFELASYFIFLSSLETIINFWLLRWHFVTAKCHSLSTSQTCLEYFI